MKKLLLHVLGTVVLAGMLFANCAEASEIVDNAEEVSEQNTIGINDALTNAKNGIVCVQIVYVDDSGKKHIVNQGTGFLLGNSSETQFAVTTNENVCVSDEVIAATGKKYGVKKADFDKMNFAIQVAVQKDIGIEAGVEVSSEEGDFSIIRISKPIMGRETLTVDNSAEPSVENGMLETSDVYALGFPDMNDDDEIQAYSYDEVGIKNGNITNSRVIHDNNVCIQHSIAISEGNSGGPLLNQNGLVIGVNRICDDDGYSYAISISEITDVMDALGIQYSKYEYKEIIDTSLLESSLSHARGIDVSAYTEDSIKAYYDELDQIEAILSSEEVTENTVSEAVEKTISADELLVKKSNMPIVLISIGVLICFGVLVTIVIYALRMNKEDNNKRREEKKKEKRRKSREKKEEQLHEQYSKLIEDVSFERGNVREEETSVLSSAMGFNDGETMVLNSANCGTRPILRRCKSNEGICVNKDTFYIGKDGLKCDYCIKGNPSISRTHVVIKRLDKSYYVEDLGATNGTYHNDSKMQSAQSIRLNNGDRIRMANEEFVFEMDVVK